MEQVSFRAMGSAMVAAMDTELPRGQAALASVPRWFAGWEAHLSRFVDASELSRLNAAAGREVPVSDVLWDVLQAALASAAWTDGLATPTVLDAVERAGYDRSFERLLAEATLMNTADALPRGGDGAPAASTAVGAGAAARRRRSVPSAPSATGAPGWRDIRIDAARRTVRLPEGVRLDFGGTAKGWAADEAARRLGVHGPALVDAGGDIAVSGPMAGGEPWSVAVADPFADGQAHVVVLRVRSGGVATSGQDYRRWRQDGQWRHHIIDPRTLEPAVSDVLSATVVARSARAAEAAAKAALILGRRAGIDWINARPTLAGLLVTDDGEVHASRRLADYLGG